jgi:SAM-dependent methyltransferase
MDNTCQSSNISSDLFWLHLRELPYFRALLRSIEARFYQDIDLPAPVLDLGCGDGHFSSVAFRCPLDVGLDPGEGLLLEAARRRSYRYLIQALGGQIPLVDNSFASAISNSVLEHIPELQPVLSEVARILKPEALFIFCVPNHQFLPSLSVAKFLHKVHLGILGSAYRDFFNRISRHYHCDPPELWIDRLEKAGFKIVRWWHYFSPQMLKVMEWGHYFGLPSLLTRWITGRWVIVPSQRNLVITSRLIRPYFDVNPVCENGVFTFYIAQKV